MLQFSAQQIALMIQGTIEGDASVMVRNFGKIEEAQAGDISFLANPKYEDFLYTTKASIIIINAALVLKTPIAATLIRVPDAYAAFATLLTQYQSLKSQQLVGIQQPSFIASSASLGENIYVAAFAHIGEQVVIGNNVKIHPSVVIGNNVTIGNDVILHPGVIVYSDCVIGNHVTIHSNSIIGSDGFGFAPTQDGSYQKVPQLGNVVIEDHVEIGSNTTIDRATIGSTHIRKGVKLDNLIQVAHNVEIGENTVIAAQCGVSGSTKIGKGVMMGGQAGIIGHLNVADGVKIAARSGITKTIKKANSVVSGFPASDQVNDLRSQVNVKNLPNLEKRVKELEILVQQLSQKG
ncbi:MAG: UDP-3-O-(3-hydroxymyristoyl)glucosamine N-acyltransferase [Chitinophagia bacterium]|jgi:UDP-3-O-[3-hydroxymyristoyl] glucosamine N-acyltransferase|nr:UDP-3-O-(3-hydroxymyristoyl)glucosamine N-acyltransferase [Chitinophagia bacterium]